MEFKGFKKVFENGTLIINGKKVDNLGELFKSLEQMYEDHEKIKKENREILEQYKKGENCTDYWSNGNKKFCSSENLEQHWYESGQIEHEANFKDDKRHGLRRGWYESGQLKFAENYICGKQHGQCLGWHENGKLEYIDTFENGEQKGLQQKWAEDGRQIYKLYS